MRVIVDGIDGLKKDSALQLDAVPTSHKRGSFQHMLQQLPLSPMSPASPSSSAGNPASSEGPEDRRRE